MATTPLARPGIFLALAATAALAPGAHAQDLFRTYHNARFGYQLQYPANLVTPQPEAQNGDGRLFRSQGGSIRLLAYGSHNVAGRSLDAEMRAAMTAWKQRGGSVTYARWKGNWLAVSGYVGGDIFYQKTVRRGSTFATLVWRYPRDLRKPLDAAVNRSAATLAFSGGQATPPPRKAVPTARPTPAPPRPNPTDGY